MTVGSAISLFSGAGGLDLGVEAAGFATVSAVEWDQDAADTMEKNAPIFFHQLVEVLRADLYPLATGADRGVTTRDILRAGGLGAHERPDLLVGGPPCVAFSKSGFWLDWKRDGVDPAASLLQAYTRVLAEARPRYFILENVYALTFDNNASKPAFTRLLHEIDAAGYRCEWKVLNAADYGVPQARPRLFVIGCRKSDKLPELPEPTHHGAWERRKPTGGPLPHVSSGEALRGLVTEPEPEEAVRGSWGHLLPEIPPGQNYLHFTKERGHPDPIFTWRSRYWSFLLKLHPAKPAPTIPGTTGTERRAVPLGQPAPARTRASTPVHLPRRVHLRRQARLRPGTDRQLGAPLARSPRRGTRRVDPGRVTHPPSPELGRPSSMPSPLLDWLHRHTAAWRPSIVGVFREDAVHDWPISASSASELRATLTHAGHLLPLPTEPAALANVMEIELRQHFLEAAALTAGVETKEGTERSYPDLETFGEAFGGGPRAVDIKCARRSRSGAALNNRIALYTGNTYFLWP